MRSYTNGGSADNAWLVAPNVSQAPCLDGEVATPEVSTTDGEIPIGRNSGLFISLCVRRHRRATCFGRAHNPGRVQTAKYVCCPSGDSWAYA